MTSIKNDDVKIFRWSVKRGDCIFLSSLSKIANLAQNYLKYAWDYFFHSKMVYYVDTGPVKAEKCNFKNDI